MMRQSTPAPWHLEIYLNEHDEKFPPNIIGVRDNYPVAICGGLDEATDLANGRLMTAAPELLDACEAVLAALMEEPRGSVMTEANTNAVNLCRAARDKAYKA